MLINYTLYELRKINKLYFGYEEIARILDISAGSAKVAASRLERQDVIIRLKRNLYMLAEKWDNLSPEEKYAIANILQVPSYISLISALSYYQITTQIQPSFFESIALNRTKRIEIKGNVFNYTKINKRLYSGFLKKGGFFIATPEKAFLDACYLTAFKKYSFDITSIDLNKLDAVKIKKMALKLPPRAKELIKKYGYSTKA